MGTLFIIGAGWLALDALILGYLWLAAQPRSRRPIPEPRTIATGTLMSAILALGLLEMARVSSAADWQPAALVGLLTGLAMASDLMPERTAAFRISGSFLALMLALVLLGPAPAIAIGLAGTLVDGARNRVPSMHVLANLAAYATFPLSGALALQSLGRGAPAVFVVTLALSLLNFVLVAGFARLMHGGSLMHMLRHTWLPVLPFEIAGAAVVAGTTLAVQHYGYAAVAVLAIFLIGLQLLLRTLLDRTALVS